MAIFLLSVNIYQVKADWHIEGVDAPHLFGYTTNRFIAITDNGIVHIAYGGDHLYYASFDGSTCHDETADASSGVGEYAFLVLGSNGKAHSS